MTSTDRPLMLRGPVMRGIFIGYLILAIGVVLGLYAAYHASQKSSRIASCVTEWADATSTRSTVLTRLSTTRTNRLDQLIRDVALRDPARFRADLHRYVDASNAYKRAVKMNPLPPPPRLRC